MQTHNIHSQKNELVLITLVIQYRILQKGVKSKHIVYQSMTPCIKYIGFQYNILYTILVLLQVLYNKLIIIIYYNTNTIKSK